MFTSNSIKFEQIVKRKIFILLFITITISSYAVEIGTIAPEIIMKDNKGRDVSLSSLKGKIVLVDFWASWCKPCREANPILTDAYLKYSHKGFEIVSVSLDEDKVQWLNAIDEDKLPWENQISDLKGWNSKVVKDYNIEALPTSFLLDREGKIVVVDPYAEDLEIELKSIFLKEVSFYPKNASNKLYFSLPVKYIIRNNRGKKVAKGNDETVDISYLDPGVYSVEFAGKKEQFLKKENTKSIVKIIFRNDEKVIFSLKTKYVIYTTGGVEIISGENEQIFFDQLDEGEYFIQFDGQIKKIVID